MVVAVEADIAAHILIFHVEYLVLIRSLTRCLSTVNNCILLTVFNNFWNNFHTPIFIGETKLDEIPAIFLYTWFGFGFMIVRNWCVCCVSFSKVFLFEIVELHRGVCTEWFFKCQQQTDGTTYQCGRRKKYINKQINERNETKLNQKKNTNNEFKTI